MIDSLVYAFHAITPIILLILTGYLLNRKGFFSDEFLKRANKLVFYVLLPCTLFTNIYQVGDIGEINWRLVFYAVFTVTVIFFLGIIAALLWVKDDRQKGVVIQCVFRSNYAIIGLSFAQALGGNGAVAVVGVLSAFTIPLFNILAVVSMAIFIKDGKRRVDIKKILKRIITNPLIIGCVLGLIALAIKSALHYEGNGFSFVLTYLSYLAKASTAIALLVLGGQFNFTAVGGLLRQITIGTIGRLVIAPAVGIGAAYLISTYTGFLDLGTAEYSALIGLFASPVAVSSAVMATEMDNDATLAGQYVFWTNVGAIVSVFLLVVIMRNCGLL
ncbi:MAG: AEC family transporter [Lachnospiraceae bacterium]|nr:AEC family transporter [Lachnospiraceae bacterium]